MCKTKIVKWLLKNIKIEKKAMYDLVDKADADSDGFVDLGEFVSFILEIVKRLDKDGKN